MESTQTSASVPVLIEQSDLVKSTSHGTPRRSSPIPIPRKKGHGPPHFRHQIAIPSPQVCLTPTTPTSKEGSRIGAGELVETEMNLHNFVPLPPTENPYRILSIPRSEASLRALKSASGRSFSRIFQAFQCCRGKRKEDVSETKLEA